MKTSLLIFLICPFLSAEFTYEGEFRAAIGGVFSIEVSTSTFSNQFTAGQISSNSSSNTLMGSFIVTINDNTTLGAGETNRVLLESINYVGTAIETRRLNQRPEITTTEERIELLFQDNKNSSGNTATTTIVNNQSIRNRTGPSAPNIVNEAHTLTFFAKQGELAGKPAGNYRTTIYFVLQQP